ncbi:UbiA family prenyltransferase [Geoglobus ahangari]
MLYNLVKWAVSPVNIIFPIPLIPLIVGLVAGGFHEVWKPIVLTFMFYPAINLWNHVNDAEDDFKAGKDNPFVDKKTRTIAILLTIFLYLLSGFYAYSFGGVMCAMFYLFVLIATFLYSDNKLTRIRLKRHYLGEITVYSISIPSYILMSYTLIKPLDEMAIKLSILFYPLLISTLFVKDLKDISADKSAGLKTLGVVFDPVYLVKVFVLLIFAYFILLAILFYNTWFNLAILPVIGAIIGVFEFRNSRWEITKRTIKYYLTIFYSAFLSLGIFLIIATLHRIVS